MASPPLAGQQAVFFPSLEQAIPVHSRAPRSHLRVPQPVHHIRTTESFTRMCGSPQEVLKSKSSVLQSIKFTDERLRVTWQCSDPGHVGHCCR